MLSSADLPSPRATVPRRRRRGLFAGLGLLSVFWCSCLLYAVHDLRLEGRTMEARAGGRARGGTPARARPARGAARQRVASCPRSAARSRSGRTRLPRCRHRLALRRCLGGRLQGRVRGPPTMPRVHVRDLREGLLAQGRGLHVEDQPQRDLGRLKRVALPGAPLPSQPLCLSAHSTRTCVRAREREHARSHARRRTR